MTTLRRVLLQSAKEAGPSEAVSVPTANKPTTPHAGKSTPRRTSPPLSGSDDESVENDAKSTEKKNHLTKRRRTSRGWEDVSGKDAIDVKSPKSTKGNDAEAYLKSPRLASKTSSSSSLISSTRSPKTIPLAPAGANQSGERGNSNHQLSILPPTPLDLDSTSTVAAKDIIQPMKQALKGDLDSTISDLSLQSAPSGSHTSLPPPPPPPALPPNNNEPPITVAPSAKPGRPTRTPSPPVLAKEPIKERQTSVSSTASQAPLSRQTTGKSSTSSGMVTTGVIAQEWVQCEDCKKWRKLPLNIAASSLPDRWYCHMNTWNVLLANCSASVEEGSEETTEEPAIASVNGLTVGGSIGIGGGAQKRNTALPPGINLYGGQVQLPPVTLGPSGAKQPRISTYRDLIGAHYRNNKQFISSFGSTCDARYAGFPTYVSPTLKSRAFDNASTLLAFPKMGWVANVKDVVPRTISSASSSNTPSPTPSTMAGSNMDLTAPLPPKLLFKTFGKS